jgi:2-dehydro-3-deoxyphosphogluconate aldolase/(4S)-4-hydroxy-2-oxoglutarate aldolase
MSTVNPPLVARSRAEIVSRLTNPGIIAVLRTEQPAQVLPACAALVAGGVRALEITLTVPDALRVLREARERFATEAVVGAGTVLDATAAGAALGAGAEFLVSPVTRPEIVPVAHAADRPVMLGACTPTEAQAAHEAGADFIKLFPADVFGPAHVRALRAPLPHLRIVPTGGVDLNTAADFLRAGCVALGVGSALLSKEILAAQDWPELTRRARSYVELAAAHRASR